MTPFTNEEIDATVQALPTDKALGVGFNTDFIKKCWPIICSDFYALCSFFEGTICLRSINGSHMTLVPKNDHAIKVLDFWPISLVNTSVKIITKMLGTRLQKMMLC